MSKKINDSDINIFHSLNIHVPTRTIYMGQETNHSMAESFIKNLHILEAISKDSIVVIMNNIGGDELDGMAIYDAIRHSPCEIIIKVAGNAMSMGSVILQAADYRCMYQHAKFMMHYGSVLNLDYNSQHVKNSYKWIDESKKFDKIMEKILLDKINKKIPSFSLSQLRKMLDFDTILTAEEALQYNFIDGIIGNKDER